LVDDHVEKIRKSYAAWNCQDIDAALEPIDTTVAHLLTVRRGKVVRLRAFFDREEALQAAGLQ
jgi:ketosteroid isomerase-like protein